MFSVALFWIISIFQLGVLCSGFDESVLGKISHTSLDDWLEEVNRQYKTLNQYSATYAWELSLNPSEDLYNEASEFGGVRSKWRNYRCSEAEELLHEMTVIQKRMLTLLCRGPKYTDYQASQVSAVLTKMQDIYTQTQICLPSGFDICINYNRIWDYTYIRTSLNEIFPLDLTAVTPKNHEDYNPLHYFDGEVSTDYYVLRGVKNGAVEEESQINERILKSPLFCLSIEPELEKLMVGNFSSLRRPDCVLSSSLLFRWAWEAWRLAVGPEIEKYYPNAVYLMNLGARNNGYDNIGESWREELESKDLRRDVERLWKDVKPFYKLLHGVFRNALWNKYENGQEVTKDGTIPAHLMGNMWSQDWSTYYKLLVPYQPIDLEENLFKTNWSSLDMVRRADDFYTSMGMKPMTKKFWEYSSFDKSTNTSKCHGSAANMFNDDDFRMIVCADRTFDDFYVIIHEMGHIQYYMNFVEQPPLFQDATNSAIGEAIGDAIFLAMMTPHHLNRLGILPDKYLFTENLSRFKENEIRVVHETQPNSEFLNAPTNKELLNTDQFKPFFSDSDFKEYFKQMLEKENVLENLERITYLAMEYPKIEALNEKMRNYMNLKEKTDNSMNAFDLTLLLRMAMSKLPQIPFEYILDIFRWDLFSEKVPFTKANEYFWKLSMKEQGIHPPEWEDRSQFFDAAAKFHVADNTPYVRYFLASFLQTQIFKGLCEVTIFGHVNAKEKLPMPLHRCDIYGSKRAGKLLQKAMKLGSSAHWTDILYILTGSREISIKPLIEYYGPLFSWLEKLVIDYQIPVGW